MTMRLLLSMAATTLMAAAPPILAAPAPRDLTVATTAEAVTAQRDMYLVPFSQASGISFRTAIWDGSIAALRSKMDAWDVVLVDGGLLAAGCNDGVFAKLDWSAIGGKDHYLPPAVSDCGVGAFTRRFALAWDRDKFPGTPGWADFWDVAKFPGKRGLQRGARMNLEIALIADGVAPGDVYRTLRTEEGVDRAFHKLEQIKPYLVWWRSPAEAPKLIASGEILLCTAPADRIMMLDRGTGPHFGIQPTGGLYQVQSWTILKTSPLQPDALKLLASMGDPVAETRFAAATGLGGLAKGLTDGMTADQASASPNNPAMVTSSLQVDEQFWHDNADRLDERFDAWLAH